MQQRTQNDDTYQSRHFFLLDQEWIKSGIVWNDAKIYLLSWNLELIFIYKFQFYSLERTGGSLLETEAWGASTICADDSC